MAPFSGPFHRPQGRKTPAGNEQLRSRVPLPQNPRYFLSIAAKNWAILAG